MKQEADTSVIVIVQVPGWPIREAVRPWKIIRMPIGKGDPMQRVNYPMPLYSPHENRKIERVKKDIKKLVGK